MLTAIPAYFVAALIPLIVGMIWYNPKVFGTVWMKAAGMENVMDKKKNMILIFILTYVLSLMMTVFMQSIVIHQTHIYSVMMGEPDFAQEGSVSQQYINNFMSKYGNHFRTFKHGMLHGAIAGLFIAVPVLGINAMFERKGFKYIAINAGYWIVAMMLMGGFICGWQL